MLAMEFHYHYNELINFLPRILSGAKSRTKLLSCTLAIKQVPWNTGCFCTPIQWFSTQAEVIRGSYSETRVCRSDGSMIMRDDQSMAIRVWFCGPQETDGNP